MGPANFFTDPRTMEMFRVDVALTHVVSKKAVALLESSLIGLDRYGITMADILRAVNDNCSTAKKTGRLGVMIAFFCNSLQSRSSTSYLCSIVAGDDWQDNPPGQCDMHLAALAVGLALSFVQRVHNRVVVNINIISVILT